MSAALATHWVANLAIGQLFLPALGAFGVSAVYLFFAAVCAATVAFTGSQVVETKARPSCWADSALMNKRLRAMVI